MSPLRKLAAIVGLPPRVQAVGDRIRRLGDEGFVAALSELARDAARGATVADADAMLACALFFLRGEPDRVAPLVAAARRTDERVALAMLDENVTGLREVVRIASRRPTMPSIVAEIVAHDRWIARMEVRTALVQNPFTPTRTALLLLPTCHARCELSDGAVHPRLRELSALLVPTT